AVALVSSIYPHYCVGQLARARTVAAALIESTRGHPQWGFDAWNISAWAFGHFIHGAVQIFTANLGPAQAGVERGIQLARQHGDPESEGWALAWLSDVAVIAGDAEIALGPCRRSVEIAEKMGSPYSRAAGYHRLGVSLTVGGKWVEAIETLEHAL